MSAYSSTLYIAIIKKKIQNAYLVAKHLELRNSNRRIDGNNNTLFTIDARHSIIVFNQQSYLVHTLYHVLSKTVTYFNQINIINCNKEKKQVILYLF